MAEDSGAAIGHPVADVESGRGSSTDLGWQPLKAVHDPVATAEAMSALSVVADRQTWLRLDAFVRQGWHHGGPVNGDDPLSVLLRACSADQ